MPSDPIEVCDCRSAEDCDGRCAKEVCPECGISHQQWKARAQQLEALVEQGQQELNANRHHCERAEILAARVKELEEELESTAEYEYQRGKRRAEELNFEGVDW